MMIVHKWGLDQKDHKPTKEREPEYIMLDQTRELSSVQYNPRMWERRGPITPYIDPEKYGPLES